MQKQARTLKQKATRFHYWLQAFIVLRLKEKYLQKRIFSHVKLHDKYQM